MKRNYVSRRLLFDEEEKISINKLVNEQIIINSQPINELEEKVSNNKIIGLQAKLKMRGWGNVPLWFFSGQIYF